MKNDITQPKMRLFEGVECAFYIQLFHDEERLEPFLKALRKHYPNSTVILRSDGDPNSFYGELAEKYGSFYFDEPRLMSINQGGAVVQRMLELLLKVNAEIFFKLDPDTHVRKRMTWLPESSESVVFGTLMSETKEQPDRIGVQGGCIGMTRTAAQKLYDSQILLEDWLKPPACGWVVNPECEQRLKRDLVSIDWSFSLACRRLDFSFWDHPEVYSVWQRLTDQWEEWGQSAFVHPWPNAGDPNYLKYRLFPSVGVSRFYPPRLSSTIRRNL